MRSERTKVDVVPLARLDALGPALRALRERARISPGDLAAGCGHLGVTVSRALVESWERSVALPTLVELVTVLVVLSASPASLFVEVMRGVWRDVLAHEPAAMEVLLEPWQDAPLERLLVLHAGWLEGAAVASGALAPRLHARLGELREQLRGEPGALGALLRTRPGEPPMAPSGGG
jgi:hypothetical protein